MSKSLRKDFRREIKKGISRFISILLMVVLGVAFYSGIRSSMPAMQKTADAVYDKENLMDIRVIGTLGLTPGDVEAIKAIEGIKDAEGVYTNDFLCWANSTEVVTKVISMPDRINDVQVTQGRFPQKYNEMVVSREFLEATGYEIGSRVSLATGTTDSVYDTLASETFEIVGVCSSSYFLNGDLGTCTIGDGKVDGYVVIPREAFVTDVFTSVYATVEGAAELDCYGEEYQSRVKSALDGVKAIAGKRCDVRFSEIRSKSSELLESARNDYYSAEATVKTELANAQQKLLETEQMLTEKRADFESEKQVLLNAQTELPMRKQQIAEAEQEIAKQEANLNRLKTNLEDSRAKLQQANSELEAIKANPNATPQDISNAENALKLVQGIYDATEKQAISGEEQLNAAKAQIAEGKKTISQIEAVLSNGNVITDAEKKLADAEIELQRGKEQYELEKQDATAELADAAEKLSKAESEINNMEVPEWYVLDRTSLESFSSFKNDSESIGALGTVFPLIFFLVAALVSLTTMTRMVEEQRTQIGTLKALGYSKGKIAFKYISYALLASVIGTTVGVFLGELTLPQFIVTAYKSVYYNLGENVVEPNARYGVTAALAAVLFTTLATIAACYKELRSTPAGLMRPEAPRAGKKILIERISFIWDRLNFGQKAAARNLFRYKKRFFMTLFGVGGCMALLLVGMGIYDSVSAMTDNQYNKVFKYDGIVSVDPTLTRPQRRTLLQSIVDISDIEDYLAGNRTMVYAYSGENSEDEKNAYMIIPGDGDKLKSFVRLGERTSLTENLNMTDEGVIITEKYANLLNVGVGDSIFIKLKESDAYPKEVKVSGISENYIFNYIYMTPQLYRTIYSTSPDVNMIMLKTVDGVNETDLCDRILKLNGATSVTMNSEEISELNEIIKMLYFIIIIMVVAAGALAFVVLYNLNNINISERRRELATLKLLGFFDSEIDWYVYRENIVLTVLGTVLGIVMGVLLHKFVITTVETDVYMFGRDIRLISVIVSVVLTLLFAALVNAVMHRKLKKIDMVESLKSVE